ncbi:DNA damage response protein DdrC [Deinococcus pimensis]|uniref:DNA damage response protein DdrC n=1 Tax=Deinococcus pimensis TaxID=309888 RepID=UPI0004826A3F|nr:DNA damage response protein DdrC [Deinococcus pimensis]
MNSFSFTKLGRQTVRTSTDGRYSAHDALAALGVRERARADALLAELGLGAGHHDFGDEAGPEPTLTDTDVATLAFALTTPEARRWREKARDLLAGYLAGDVHLAAEIAERNPDAEKRRWLSARLESTEARKRFMSTVARHGGEGDIFRQVSSLSNRSVLNMNSAAFRRERGVRDTRDGMTASELMRLTYLETASAQAIEAHGAHGNDAILDLHRRNADNERKVWRAALGQAS